MKYEDIDESTIVTRSQVESELAKHGYKIADFDDQFGNAVTYSAMQVLIWMGY